MTDEPADTRAAVEKFPETTKQVLEYYKTTASDEEKKAIAQAIRQAARTVKQDLRGDDDEKKKKKKARAMGQPTPEALAAALYGILSQDAKADVSGDPREGEETSIEGDFDLNEVARKLLSLA